MPSLSGTIPTGNRATDAIRLMVARLTGERVLWIVMAVAVIGIAVVPLLYVLNAAFLAETRTGLSTERSLEAIIDVYTSAAYLGYFAQALTIALIVTAVSLTYGIVLAFLVARTNVPRPHLIDFLVISPLFISPFTGLIAWVALGSAKSGFINGIVNSVLGPFGLPQTSIVDVWSYGGIIWVMFLFFCPLAYLFTIGNLRAMDSSLEEAARTAGATSLQTVFRVTLPLSLPSIFAAGLLIFIHAAEMYTIPGMLGSIHDIVTLPWQIYLDSTSFPAHFAHAAASGTLLLWVTVVGVALQRRLSRHAERFTTVTGKGFRARPIRLGAWKWPAILFVGLFVLSADILPLAALVVMSCMKYTSPVITSDVLTLHQFNVFFSLENMIQALWNTVWLAVLSGAVCVLIGLLVSFNDVRRGTFMTKLIAFVCIIPIAVPGVLYGVGLLWTFLRTPLYGTTWVLMLAYIAKSLPYSILVSRSAVQQIHPDLEHSARISGASGLVALRAITIPLLLPTLIAILTFVMLTSIKELAASVLLYTQRSQVLSVLTWEYMDSGDYQFAAAIAVVQTAIITALILLTRAIFRVRLEEAYGRG